ncbi:High potential iron-sulfur protein [Fodinibius roseus]|uniref:High-potential iron-sulfur protein n=1 Tax=Fodinibius roseus TaxID=1194090 RepID=A0A1M4W230_9BACT|nr:high-potential iron-sulfur protein [Fodinibius roseus]SHE75210.1 High potential iron-sulfur protein [Fodinibius roseus]
MKNDDYSRRTFIRKFFQLGSACLGFGMVAGGCQSEDSDRKDEGDSGNSSGREDCEDLSGINQEEIQKREVYGYVKESSYPNMSCSNCSLYLEPESGNKCGGCVLFDGPVFAEGYCDYWEPNES